MNTHLNLSQPQSIGQHVNGGALALAATLRGYATWLRGYVLFLVLKSSSEGFLSGFLLGSSFFMLFGLLLWSWERDIQRERERERERESKRERETETDRESKRESFISL